MRRSFVRIVLFGWLLFTILISLRLYLSTDDSPSTEQTRVDPMHDPMHDPGGVLRFHARGVSTPHSKGHPKDKRTPTATPRTIPMSGLELGHRDPVKEHRDPVKEHRDPVKEHRDPVKEHRDPVKEHRDPVKEHRDPVKERRRLIGDFKAQVHMNNRTGWEEYFRFKNTGSGRIWPELQGEMEDRILNQIHLVHPDPPAAAGKKLKKILLYHGLDNGMRRGQERFLEHRCPINQCTLTDDLREEGTADAILFKDFVTKPLFSQRPPNQIWIIFLLESAVSRPSLEKLANVVNWTATYRTDSTIVTPYERFTFYANYTSLPDRAPMDYVRGKTKKVAWFVSNCAAANGRHNYVKELKKYIDVDIYGLCGTLSCYRGNSECNEKLRKYKFYLAFENSNCVDYITEKIYWNALGRNLSDPNNVVPVVMGARPEDYARLAPPGSYIHVDDFESPKALAEYLLKVDRDDDLYNSYFRWKGTGDYIDTKFWCRLCAMIHEAGRKKRHQVYEKLHEWWVGEGACVGPTSRDGWASWRNTTTHRYDHTARYVRTWDQ